MYVRRLYTAPTATASGRCPPAAELFTFGRISLVFMPTGCRSVYIRAQSTRVHAGWWRAARRRR